MKKAEEHQAVSFCLVFDVTARTTTPIVGGGGGGGGGGKRDCNAE